MRRKVSSQRKSISHHAVNYSFIFCVSVCRYVWLSACLSLSCPQMESLRVLFVRMIISMYVCVLFRHVHVATANVLREKENTTPEAEVQNRRLQIQSGADAKKGVPPGGKAPAEPYITRACGHALTKSSASSRATQHRYRRCRRRRAARGGPAARS